MLTSSRVSIYGNKSMKLRNGYNKVWTYLIENKHVRVF